MATTYFRYRNYLWPANKVPYTTQNFPKPDLIQKAIEHWSQTKIDFEELHSVNTNSPESYLIFKYEKDPATLSHTDIGHQKGKKIHQVVITSANTDILRALLHEMGHTLGLLHEHQRQERDFFIKINQENRDQRLPFEAFKHNVFLKNETSVECIGIRKPNNRFVNYDFESIMHYHQFAFADPRNRRRTIEIKDPRNSRFQNDMGTEAKLSTSDIVGIKNMYGL